MKRINNGDLEHVLNKTHDLWEDVRDKSIFITGATGFFGKWLLETFLYINKKLSLNAKVVALSRNPNKFLADFPFYEEEKAITFIQGDISNFNFPDGSFEYIVHAATDADTTLHIEESLLTLDSILAGTRRILDFARKQPALKSFMLTSSGAVYGTQPEAVTHIAETDSFFIDINNPASSYAEGKRVSELYCSIYHKVYAMPVKIARCFAFVGPYLPINRHFAIGNFIGNAIKQEEIVIKGDGTPMRSYMYAADLAVWLWTILLKGESNTPYNVGSDIDLSIEEAAHMVASLNAETIQIKVLQPKNGGRLARYVPCVNKAKNELSLSIDIDLKEALRKTMSFYTI